MSASPQEIVPVIDPAGQHGTAASAVVMPATEANVARIALRCFIERKRRECEPSAALDGAYLALCQALFSSAELPELFRTEGFAPEFPLASLAVELRGFHLRTRRAARRLALQPVLGTPGQKRGEL